MPRACLSKTFILFLWIYALTLCGEVSAVEFRTAEFAGKRVTVCLVDVHKDHIELFDRDDGGSPFKHFDSLNAWLVARGKRLVFAMNAGMYTEDFSPLGLFVSHSQQLVPLNISDGQGNFYLKPNGVFVLTEAGASVVETNKYGAIHGPVILATQSGPLLVYKGKINPAFNPKSQSRLMRNGVGVGSPGVAVFAISEDPINFYEFAILFRDVLHCPNALFLDGTVSSLYSSALNRNDSRMDLGPIIAVTQ